MDFGLLSISATNRPSPVFNAELFATYQAMRVLEARGQTGRRYRVFSDSQAAIRRALNDSSRPGQQWAKAFIEVAGRVTARDNHIWICWVPAHKGVQGNETADEMAKEAAGGQSDEVPDRVRWQVSLPLLSRRATERRTETTTRWVRDHVRPERRYVPPGGGGFRKRALRQVQKATAQRYCQLLTGHAAIGSFLHDRMTGSQRLEPDICWWRNCGRSQPRYHLFVDCRAGPLRSGSCRRE